MFSTNTKFILSVLAEFFIKLGITLSAALTQQVSTGGSAAVTWPHPVVWVLGIVVGVVGAWSEVKTWVNKENV